jgi:hypothetical protein
MIDENRVSGRKGVLIFANIISATISAMMSSILIDPFQYVQKSRLIKATPFIKKNRNFR